MPGAARTMSESVRSALHERVVLVTGASSGIGAATARALAAEGARVVAAARRADRLAALAAEIGGVALTLDVADADAVARAIAEIVGLYGGLDGVVNSAGVLLGARVAGAAVDDWKAMLEANLVGALLVTRAALPHLVARRGHVVNVSSVSGRLANPGSSVYAATKRALDTFSEALRKECVGTGVRVTVVAPGVVETELFDAITDAATRERFAALRAKLTPLDAADVARAIVFAMSQPPNVGINEIVIRPIDEP